MACALDDWFQKECDLEVLCFQGCPWEGWVLWRGCDCYWRLCFVL